MPRIKRWTTTSTNDGTGEVRLISWKYFHDFIYQEMLDYKTYIWRGQRCDNWLLESTFDRLVKKAKISKAETPDFRKSHLEQFKYATRGRRGHSPRPIESENEWWALGQHHGLATPLLDWTNSPFVAAYFAFIGVGQKQTSHRAVYGLHIPGIEKKANDLFIEERQARREQDAAEAKESDSPLVKAVRMASYDHIRVQVEFVKPLSDENQRLVNQGGLFSRGPEGTDFEAWIKSNFKENTAYQLIKIFIPNKDREECLTTLNRMNINHSTLFPDLYGASIYCNMFGEFERY